MSITLYLYTIMSYKEYDGWDTLLLVFGFLLLLCALIIASKQ